MQTPKIKRSASRLAAGDACLDVRTRFTESHCAENVIVTTVWKAMHLRTYTAVGRRRVDYRLRVVGAIPRNVVRQIIGSRLQLPL